MNKTNLKLAVLTFGFLFFIIACDKDTDPDQENIVLGIEGEPFDDPEFNIDQALSDEAQRNTIAFDALGFMTSNLGALTFLPPGKVADYSGFQYFRDNDQTKLGHNTSFVTIISYNILEILTETQVQQFVDGAEDQIDLINAYAYKRFPLCKAFKRLIENDLPDGTTGLDEDAVKAYSAEVYEIDGEISYGRAQLFYDVLSTLSDDQKDQIQALFDLEGIGNWPSDISDPLEGMGLDIDENVAVMTYASEIFAWYAGSTTADVYINPERQGTYFGSFYLKDWPAMGNPDYTIDETMTSTAGQQFLEILTTEQYEKFVSLVELQYPSLLGIVDTREEVSTELRKFLSEGSASEETVLALSEEYGEYDGELIYLYATYFSEVYQTLSEDQKTQISDLANNLDYVDSEGAFLYSQPIPMPEIENTDFLFK
ncbi:MAG: hypothetical protein GY834_11615 [Bacteroidetes bacterium]|nr:hypothetical protein [Bacteroidota bacterium]